ncbi:MAG: hypothetical protein ACOCG5_08515 [Candidatus Alkaliphilus sp. MAG34]
MKKTLLIALLIISMLAVVGFTSAGASYWEDMKEIYEWKAMEGVSEAEFSISVPSENLDYQFKVHINAKSSLDDFCSYSEIKVEDLKGLVNIPVIKMYTKDSDIYINKEAVLALLSALNVDDVEIKEDFVMLKNDQVDIEMDFNALLNDVIGLVEKMDLGVDLDMKKDGNTYTLTVKSDELIDLLDAYIRFIIENIDQLPESLLQGQEIEITEEEKQEMLEGYDAFVGQFKDLAKGAIEGSKFSMESTFEEDKYSENTQFNIKIMGMGEFNMKTEGITSRLETFDLELPTSVMVITAEELGELIADKIGGDTGFGLKAVIGLDGTYVKFVQSGVEDGQVPLKIIDDKAYIAVEDAEKLFGVKLEGLEDPFHIRRLDDFGFHVEWNEENRLIEIY